MRFCIGHIAILWVALLALTACGSDAFLDDDENVAEQEQVQIYFTINMGSPSTRATWGDNIDNDNTNDYDSLEATYNENTIDPEKFQVLVFDTNDKYLAELSNLTYFRHSDTGNNIYDVVGTLSVDKSYVEDNKLQCKLVVLANYDTKVSNISTLSNLESITYSYSNHLTADIVAGKAGIPMFGMKTTGEMKMNAGFRTDAGTIYMLRAMAKIRVATTLGALAMESVTLTNYNTTGYIVPNGFADENTEDLEIATTFHPYSSKATTTTELSFAKESDTSFFIYVPEYGGYTSDDNTPKITIHFDFSIVAETESFYFDTYTNGVRDTKYPNIERNNAYNFTVKKETSFIVTTTDWTDIFNNTFTFK